MSSVLMPPGQLNFEDPMKELKFKEDIKDLFKNYLSEDKIDTVNSIVEVRKKILNKE